MKLLAIPTEQASVSTDPQFIRINEQEAVDFSVRQARIQQCRLSVGEREQTHSESTQPKLSVSTLRQRDDRRRGQTGQHSGLRQLLDLATVEAKRPFGDVRDNNSTVVVFRHGGDLGGLHAVSVSDALKLAVI